MKKKLILYLITALSLSNTLKPAFKQSEVKPENKVVSNQTKQEELKDKTAKVIEQKISEQQEKKEISKVNNIQIKFKPIFFEDWKTEILNKDDLKEDIDLARNVLQKHSSFQLLLVGGAAKTEDPAQEWDNMILSKRRASIVREEFKNAGIPAELVSAYGIGSQEADIEIDKKVSQEDLLKQQQKDRTVDIYIALPE